MAELAASPGGALGKATRSQGRRGGSGASLSTTLPRIAHILHRTAVAVAVLVLVVATTLVVFRGRYDGRVMPSVVVAEVDIGGLARGEAQAAVAARSDALLAAPLTFTYGRRTWTPTLAQLGVSADPSAAVDSAFAVGREESARDRLASSFDAPRDTRHVALPMSVDRAAGSRWAESITTELGLAPQDARIDVAGAEVTLVEDQDGIVVDPERLSAIVQESISTMRPYDGPLPILATPAEVRADDLAGEVALLTAALSEPVTIVYKKKRWTLQPADLGGFVQQQARADGPGVVVEVDREALAEWLRELVSESINREARDAVVAWNGDRLGVVEQSSDGLRIRPDSLADAVAESFFGSHAAVTIPVRTIEPAIDSDNLEELKIEQRLGTGSSNFQGSDEGRSTNVIVGAEQLNGAMVPPGADFSFNDAIGDITEDKGYVEASVVQGERIGKDIGGGICQVSTTIFRAAYESGMPIVEWNPHLYRLGFYEIDGYVAGLDASILQEGPRENWGDFQFNNPTDGWLLIESYIVETQVVVIIYGPKTGWEIIFEEPIINAEGENLKAEEQEDIEIVDPELGEGTIQQSEYALDGLETSHQRIVKDADGNVLRDYTFYTRFAARGDVYKVSPDMEGQSPASQPDVEQDESAE